MCSWLLCERLSRILINHRGDRIIKPAFVLTLTSNQMEHCENFYIENGRGWLKMSSLALGKLLFLFLLKDHLKLDNSSIP